MIFLYRVWCELWNNKRKIESFFLRNKTLAETRKKTNSRNNTNSWLKGYNLIIAQALIPFYVDTSQDMLK
jgi:hypothetical protein